MLHLARLTFLRDNVTYFHHLLDPIAIHGGLDVSVLKVEKLNTYTQLKKKLPSVNHAYTLQYTFYDWQSGERIRNSEFRNNFHIYVIFFVLATLRNESFISNFTDPLMHPCETAWRRTTRRDERWENVFVTEMRLGWVRLSEVGNKRFFCEKDSNLSLYSHLELDSWDNTLGGKRRLGYLETAVRCSIFKSQPLITNLT